MKRRTFFGLAAIPFASLFPARTGEALTLTNGTTIWAQDVTDSYTYTTVAYREANIVFGEWKDD